MKKHIALACLSVISSTVLGMIPNDPNDNSRQNNKREFDVFSENTGESSRNVKPRTSLTADSLGFHPINSTLPMSSQNSLFVNNIGSQQTPPRPLPANALSQANQINPMFMFYQPAINQNSMQINQQIAGIHQPVNSFYQQPAYAFRLNQLLFQQHATLLKQQSTIQEKDIELAKLKNSLLKQQSTIQEKDTELTKFKKVLLKQQLTIEKIGSGDASAFLSLKGNFSNLQSLSILCADLANLSLDNLSFPKLTELSVHKPLSNNLDKTNELISKTSSTLQKLAFDNMWREKPFFTTIPNSVWSCKNLTSLEITDVGISNIPEEIGKLQNLKKLILYNNELSTLPPKIGNLKNLHTLNLEANRLNALPPEIGNLKNLHTLNLESNGLNTLPPEIGNLKNLYELNLNDNFFETLPPEIGNLKNLHILNLKENYLQTLPPEIGNLRNLDYLNVTNTPLVTLPSEIGNLINLERLCLDYYIEMYEFSRELEEFPTEIWNLKKLKSVFLSDDVSIRRFSNIDISNEDYEDGQDEWIMENTKKLSMNNQNMDLTTLPVDIIMCATVKEINLRNNRLPEIPDLFYKLRELKKLDVSKNNEINSIDKINDVIFGLPRLKSLILSADIREIPEIKDIIENTSKATFDVEYKNPQDIDLIKILNKEANGKFRVKYTKDAFSKIRKDRIRKIKGKLQKIEEEKNQNILDYLYAYKNNTKLSKKNIEEFVEQHKDRHNLINIKMDFLKNIRDSIRSAETYNPDESDSDSDLDSDSDAETYSPDESDSDSD